MTAGFRSLMGYWIGGAFVSALGGVFPNIKETTAVLLQPSAMTITLIQPGSLTCEEII